MAHPDIFATGNKITQVTEKGFSQNYIKLHNKVIQNIKESLREGLEMQQLEKETLQLGVFSNESFANNRDLSSELIYIVLLCDMSGRAKLLHYSSHRRRRVDRSALGREIYAFADAFDYASGMKHDVEMILNNRVLLQICTDSKKLSDINTNCSTTTEKRLQIDVKVVREAYERFEISDIGFLKSQNNPLASFTKLAANN